MRPPRAGQSNVLTDIGFPDVQLNPCSLAHIGAGNSDQNIAFLNSSPNSFDTIRKIHVHHILKVQPIPLYVLCLNEDRTVI